MSDDERSRLIEEVQRGDLARQIISNPLWAETFSVMEKHLVSMWIGAPAADVEGREACWRMLQAARNVRHNIERIMQTGKMAEQQIEEMRNGRSSR